MKKLRASIVLFATMAMVVSGCSMFKSNCDCPKFSKSSDAQIESVALGTIPGSPSFNPNSEPNH